MDLGSMQTSIYLASQEELVLREPTQVLVNADNIQEILCVGNEARAMSGRTSRDAELISPIQNGVVADIDLTDKAFWRGALQTIADQIDLFCELVK